VLKKKRRIKDRYIFIRVSPYEILDYTKITRRIIKKLVFINTLLSIKPREITRFLCNLGN